MVVLEMRCADPEGRDMGSENHNSTVWNELPDEIKGASTVSVFKYQLNKHKKPPPMYFHASTRK